MNWILGSLLLGALVAAPAAALKTSVSYRVSVDGSGSGSWRVRQRVEDTGEACRYTVRWRGLCRIDEFKAAPDIDCEVARRHFFNTAVMKAEGEPCGGRDESGQRSRIILFEGGEFKSGRIHGIVQSASVGDVQSIFIRPR